jgi:hypothetical protein
MMKLLAGIPFGQNPDNAPAPPGSVFSPAMLAQYPMSAPGQPNIVNWAAFGAPSSAGKSIHFLPKSEN